MATISIMVLLALIAVGLLSLSTTVIRGAGADSAKAEAQANARLALMMALGDLQKFAGSDRRVTAPASILDDSIAARKRNWTTVWNTSDWDVEDPVDSRDDGAFLAALVSRRDVETGLTRGQITSALSKEVPLSDPSWIGLLSDGSVAEEEDHVYAEKIEVNRGRAKGSYAYWVGDEGVKARFDSRIPDDHQVKSWAEGGSMGMPAGTGVHKMEGLEAYLAYLPDGEREGDLSKFIDFRTTELSEIEGKALQNHFHHLTTSHVGLLVDNRWGGIRRDLSTAFELEAEEFAELEEFNASEESNQTGSYSEFIPSDVETNPLYYSQDTDEALGYLFEVPVDSSNRYRGPTWDLLRNHYRIYKEERNELGFRGTSPGSGNDALVAHGIMPFSYTKDGVGNANASVGANFAKSTQRGTIYPTISAHGETGGTDPRQGNFLQATVQKLTPQLLRAVLVYGLARDGNKYHVTIDPYFVFHNPYNRPLDFHSLSADLNGVSRLLRFRVDYTDTKGKAKSVKFEAQEGISNKGQVRNSLQSYRLKAPTGGSYRLEPGEIKLMSVDAAGGDHVELDDGHIAIALTALEYNEASGVVLGGKKGSQEMKVQTNSTLTITVQKGHNHGGNIKYSSIFTRLLHPQRATGGSFDLEDATTLTGNGQRKEKDLEAISLIQQMRVDSVPFPEIRVSANYNQIGSLRDGGKYLCTLDMGLKDFGGDVAVMSDFNYRSLGIGNRDYDARGHVIAPNFHHIAPHWEMELKNDGGRLNLQLADEGGSYWGEAKTQAGGGSNRIVLFDLPRAPLASLAALQHADISMLSSHPLRAISNSRMQVGQDDQKKIFNRLGGNRHQIDISWAANEALWDRYYFSGINWGDQSSQTFRSHRDAVGAVIEGDTKRALANPRISLIKSPDPDSVDELQDYTKLGRYLAIPGAFNVNSTSVEAWKAVLSSLSGRELAYLSGKAIDRRKADPSTSPMSRFTTPAGWDDDDYSGFRSLSESELGDLAEEIVAQVKLRGPFMGLSDFVNRRLASDETGEAGALQAAIDESGINSSVKIGSTKGNSLENSAPDANEGMARHLGQADVLTPLAPIIATRSDTFTVRAYGDSIDSKGNVLAQAWCEATVQRVPDWVQNTDEPGTVKHPDYPHGNSTAEPILRQWQPNPDLPETNRRFGRKFKVVSFRWLAADEV